MHSGVESFTMQRPGQLTLGMASSSLIFSAPSWLWLEFPLRQRSALWLVTEFRHRVLMLWLRSPPSPPLGTVSGSASLFPTPPTLDSWMSVTQPCLREFSITPKTVSAGHCICVSREERGKHSVDWVSVCLSRNSKFFSEHGSYL